MSELLNSAPAETVDAGSTEPAETVANDRPQYESGNTYDPSGNSELDDVRLRLNSKPLDEKWISAIRGAAGKKHFPLEKRLVVYWPIKNIFVVDVKSGSNL